MLRSRTALLLCALLAFLAFPAIPAPAGQFTIAVPSDACPSPALLADLARLLLRKAGLTPQVIQMPTAGIGQALANGAAGAALADASLARAAGASNLGPALHLKLVVLPRATTVLRSPRDLGAKTLSLARTDASLLRTARQLGATPLPAQNTGDAIRLALAGRADAVLGWERVVLARLQKNRYPARALGKPITLAAYSPCLLLAKSGAAQRNRLSDALLHLVRSGALDAEASRHLQ
ncbi:transporter substrate-binding domain-containing protein [Pseudodesulfovibrio sp.]|uniref:transporter substrate-binding domain-containing protein n=1 Tax=Pseudodesulfovibrio sp. TaxID=2035812 RepID=UPI00262EE137|nr:transporter substrate-binding domain-containing protein [Pseudodesulfovibrio sp.]MDD3311283.1 transporter substrate-binding domain-containing protein [Pseudodesulfovibrio sp.]